jgi:hypothetical protein
MVDTDPDMDYQEDEEEFVDFGFKYHNQHYNLAEADGVNLKDSHNQDIVNNPMTKFKDIGLTYEPYLNLLEGDCSPAQSKSKVINVGSFNTNFSDPQAMFKEDVFAPPQGVSSGNAAGRPATTIRHCDTKKETPESHVSGNDGRGGDEENPEGSSPRKTKKKRAGSDFGSR